MKFGVREICDVVFKAKNNGSLGRGTKAIEYTVGQPVLFIDSAKTSTIEGAATTAYATGGRGNTRLISWEGEKTLTFTVEDALLSPIGFALLSGAGLFEAGTGEGDKKAYVHRTAEAMLSINSTTGAEIDLTDALGNDDIKTTAPVFIVRMDRGSLGEKLEGFTYASKKLTKASMTSGTNGPVFVDFYVEKSAGVTQLEIDAGNFAGYWYVEASTLFRREEDGKDMPAEIVFPNIKIQSNFTFTMAGSGDPSTFTFTMDALPGYTRFDKTKRVLCAIQIVDDNEASAVEGVDSVGNGADDETQYPASVTPPSA